MELQFSITDKDVNKLKEIIISKRNIRLRKINKFIEQCASFILKVIVPLITIAIVSYIPFVKEHVSLLTKIISLGFFLISYAFLWYRHGDLLMRFFSQYVIDNRLNKSISKKINNITGLIIAKKTSQLKGIYQIKIENDRFIISGPNNIEISFFFKEIIKFCENYGFYEVATNHSSRLGFSYLIPTISKVMDEGEYKKNIKLILGKCVSLKN